MTRVKIRLWSAVIAIACVVALISFGGEDDGDGLLKQKQEDVKVLTLRAWHTGTGMRLAYKFVSNKHGERGEWQNPFPYVAPGWQQSMQIEKGDTVVGWVDVIVAYEGRDFIAGCVAEVTNKGVTTPRDGPKTKPITKVDSGWLIRCQWTESNVS